MSTAPIAAAVPLPVGRLVGVGLVVFLANAALLVLQLAAGRLLSPFIGSSLETWTSIIGVFLAGIALGNAFGGKLADRYPSPKTLAVVLGVGAVAALWMMFFPQLLTSTGAYKSIPLGSRIPILALALCLPAGLVLSLLTPLAIKLGLPDVAHTGRVAGLIFALSTFGCLLGNYVTGFYLIPAFPINTLVLVAAGSLIVLAGVSLVVVKPHAAELLSNPSPKKGVGEESSTNGPASSSALSPSLLRGGVGEGSLVEPNPHAFPDIRQAYLIVFLASFCGMTLELTASRVLAQFLGVSLFTWTGIIGVMLAGTALGNFTGGQIADRAARPEAKLSPRFFLAATLLSAGGATVLLLVTMAIITRYGPFDEWGPIAQVMGWTFSMFFLPMFALGLVSPQVIRLAVPDVARVGEVAGRVYAWSTTGAIVGTFAAGYVLLSTFGMYCTVLGAALVLSLTSLLVVNIWKDAREATRADDKTVAYNAAGAGVLLYLFSIVLGGIFGGFLLTNRPNRDEGFVARVESNYYTITVNRDGKHPTALKLTLDHLVHSSVDPYDPEYLYYTHEHIQMEFLQLARTGSNKPKALVIGGGGYTFPRYAMERMPEARVDVVEIDPKVTFVAREYLGLKDYKGLNAIHMDGRQFVAEKVERGTYDLVIQDAVNDLSVPAHLMTKEYNDAVKATLRPDGVYLLTIIDSIAYGKLWKAAMATLAKTFPAGNIVLLTAEAPPTRSDTPESQTAGEKWDESRRVMVIYASDKRLNLDAVRDAVVSQAPFELWFKLSIASIAIGASDIEPEPSDGPPPELGIARFVTFSHTIEVPAARLKPYTDREPGVVLTDQFCPIDNLMAEVFRQRNK